MHVRQVCVYIVYRLKQLEQNYNMEKQNDSKHNWHKHDKKQILKCKNLRATRIHFLYSCTCFLGLTLGSLSSSVSFQKLCPVTLLISLVAVSYIVS